MVYGQGLERNQSLGSLFREKGHYLVTDNSRPGKSNLLIALDTYKNFLDHDVFVLGWTYAERFGIRYQNQNLDFYPGYHNQGLDLNNQDLDLAHNFVYKFFYTVFDRPFSDDLSDLLIDTLIYFLLSQGKKVIAFSWQPRNTQISLFLPYLSPVYRQSDGHLNSKGTIKLYEILQNLEWLSKS